MIKIQQIIQITLGKHVIMQLIEIPPRQACIKYLDHRQIPPTRTCVRSRPYASLSEKRYRSHRSYRSHLGKHKCV